MTPMTGTLPPELRDLYGEVSTSVESVGFDAVDLEFRPVRFGERPERVKLFTEILEGDPEALPPVILVQSHPFHLIADGWHRIWAWAELNVEAVPAILLGSLPGMTAEQTARLVGARMTALASESLTKAERKELATALAEDHPDWSDRRIGREAGLDHKTVATLRREPAGDEVGTESPERSADQWTRTVDQAARQLDRFVATLRESAVFDNVSKFRQGTARRLAAALANRFGSDAPKVASVTARYFTEAAEALEEEA